MFYAGAPAEHLYVIRSGRLRVFTTLPGGEEQVLRLLGPGEILGYRPVLAGEPYNASAEAIEDSQLCIVPASDVRQRLHDDPEFALEMLAKLARELRHSEELMMDLVHRPVSQRVARTVLGLATGPAARERGVIRALDLSRKHLARMVGTTPETLSRTLHGFARRGLVALTRDTIRIRDESRLRLLAGERADAT